MSAKSRAKQRERTCNADGVSILGCLVAVRSDRWVVLFVFLVKIDLKKYSRSNAYNVFLVSKLF